MSCPVGFGELNIPSSRAFWDDCDEDEPTKEEQVVKQLELQYEAGETAAAPPAVDIFLLIEGVDIVQFAETTLLAGTRRICKIPTSKSSLHYNKDKQLLVAILHEDLTNSGEITELLLPYAKQAKQVITLTIKSKIEYKSEQLSDVRELITFLRGINSLPQVPALEAPNFIAGVAAGVASWRHNEKCPVSAYVAYTDNVALDTLAARPILELLPQLGISCTTSYKPPFKEQSHLYM